MEKKVNFIGKWNFWILLAIVVIIAGIVIFYSIGQRRGEAGQGGEEERDEGIEECNYDNECVPASCCHPKECTSIANAPKCSGIFCTMQCAPNTLDCGQGSCKCMNKQCKAVYE